MKQAQPSTTTIEAASRPASGRKTATGLFDSLSRGNLWETKTFTQELRWGMRYSQSDPIGLSGGPNPFWYADSSPFRFADRRGLKCSAWEPLLSGPRGEFGAPAPRDVTYTGYDNSPEANVITAVITFFMGGPKVKPPKGPTGPGTSIDVAPSCCRVDRGHNYSDTFRVVRRECDCCTPEHELEFTGSSDIRLVTADYHPSASNCREIWQYGHELLSRRWTGGFEDWDGNDCTSARRSNGGCTGPLPPGG